MKTPDGSLLSAIMDFERQLEDEIQFKRDEIARVLFSPQANYRPRQHIKQLSGLVGELGVLMGKWDSASEIRISLESLSGRAPLDTSK